MLGLVCITVIVMSSNLPVPYASPGSVSPDAVTALAPYQGASGDAQVYERLYAQLADLVDAHGYEPCAEKEVSRRGIMRLAGPIVRQVVEPLVLSNGALVTARAMFEPDSSGNYDARRYGDGTGFSMIAAAFPYRGLMQANRFYGTRGSIAGFVVDRIAGPNGEAPYLYAASAGNVPSDPTRPNGNGFTPSRTLLIGRGAGMAVLRSYPHPGSWDGMHEERVTADGITQISRELTTLLGSVAAPDMRPRVPSIDAVPDISAAPSRTNPPYCGQPDWDHQWLPLARSA